MSIMLMDRTTAVSNLPFESIHQINLDTQISTSGGQVSLRKPGPTKVFH